MSNEEKKDLPEQVIIRDKELIAHIDAERRARGDGSCVRTAEKILLKWFAQNSAAQPAMSSN